jgi:hypothetical protein
VRYDAGHVTRNPDGDCRGTGGTPHSFRSLSVKRRPDSDGPFGKRGDRAMAASGQLPAWVARSCIGSSAPFSDIPGIELEPRVRLEAATRLPAADRGPHAAGSDFGLVCYCYIIPMPIMPIGPSNN